MWEEWLLLFQNQAGGGSGDRVGYHRWENTRALEAAIHELQRACVYVCVCDHDDPPTQFSVCVSVFYIYIYIRLNLHILKNEKHVKTVQHQLNTSISRILPALTVAVSLEV